MAFRYPYTNLHELNLDWVLEEVKKVQDFDERITRVENCEILTDIELESVKAAIAPTFSTNTAYAIGSYVWHNENLYRFNSVHYAGDWDASQATQVTDTNELRFAIQSIAPRFNQETENLPGSYVFYSNALYKLENGHAVNQTWANTPKTYVQISTELEALTAADADLAENIVDVGLEVNALKSEITDEVSVINFTSGMNNTYRGVTFEYVDKNTLKVYGTATAGRWILCFNGQNDLLISSDTNANTAPAGKYRIKASATGATTHYALNATYTTFANRIILAGDSPADFEYDFTNPFILSFPTDSGYNYGTSDNPTIFKCEITKLSAVDYVSRPLESVDSDSSDETGKTDRTAEIQQRLDTFGYCELGAGTFFTTGITVPKGGCLRGQGKQTNLRLFSSVTTGACVTIQKNALVSDMQINGSYSNISTTTEGGRNGIAFIANYDATPSVTTDHCFINNVWIRNFNKSGIYCHNTSIRYDKSLYVNNAYIDLCHKGINIDYYSEFNKFNNVCVNFCKYAVVNNSGNNTFNSCTFHATSVAMYMDGTQPNSGHGTINDCTFCHTGSNTGSAITMSNITAGFSIVGCNFWYNSIDLSSCGGIVFSGCEFGRGTTGAGATINITDGDCIIFNGCTFINDVTYPPDITVTNNAKVKFDSCYGSVSGNAISA